MQWLVTGDQKISMPQSLVKLNGHGTAKSKDLRVKGPSFLQDLKSSRYTHTERVTSKLTTVSTAESTVAETLKPHGPLI